MNRLFKYSKTLMFSAALFILSTRVYAVDNACWIEPDAVSVGKDGYTSYFFVTDATTWWRLGPISDETAKQRYATAMAAVTTGQRLQISYNTGSNCVPGDLWDEDMMINYVRMIE